MFDTRDKLTAFGIQPIKSLGQNFLAESGIAENIVEAAQLGPEDFVIEIGPGLGIMTEIMAEQAGFVAAVEIDKNLIPPLRVLSELHSNLAIIHADILKLDIQKEILDKYRKPSHKNIKVVANLPYYITTPIIMSLLEMRLPCMESMVFMVQKEVGQRMTAAPGGKDYGALTVAVNYFTESEIMFLVPPHFFVPRPAVDSCVVRLSVRKEAPFLLADEKYFFRVVKAAFGQRRKMLTNALANAPYLGVTREAVAAGLTAMGKDLKVRGETLSPSEFATLSNFLRKI